MLQNSTVATECPALTTPINGEVSANQTQTGNVAVYTCNEGYILEGEATRMCSSFGTWSGSAPLCVPKG